MERRLNLNRLAQRLHMELRLKLKEKDSGINDIEDLIEQYDLL